MSQAAQMMQEKLSDHVASSPGLGQHDLVIKNPLIWKRAHSVKGSANSMVHLHFDARDRLQMWNDERTDSFPTDWSGVDYPESQAYSKVHLLESKTTGFSKYPFPVDSARGDRILLPLGLPSQVHNHSVDSSHQWASQEFLWTELEGHEATHDSDSTASIPSLLSSQISSIQTNIEGLCITPDAFKTAGPLPLLRGAATHSILCVDSPSSSFSLKPPSASLDFMPRKNNFDSSHSISMMWDSDGDSADLSGWYPTKFECIICQERFLVDSQLQDHIRIHDKPLSKQRSKRKRRGIDSNRFSSFDTLNRSLLHNLLASRKRPAVDEHLKISREGVVSQENSLDQQHTPHNQLFSGGNELLRRPRYPGSGDKKLATLSASYAIHRPKNSPSPERYSVNQTPELASMKDRQQHCARSWNKNESSASCQIESKTSADHIRGGDDSGQGELHNWSDIRFWNRCLDSPRAGFNEEVLSMIKTLLSSTKESMMAHFMSELLPNAKPEWTSKIQKYGNASGSRTDSAASAALEPDRNLQTVTNLRAHRQGNDRETNRLPGDDADDEEDDEQRAPKRPKTVPGPPDMTLKNASYACPYRKHDPRKYSVREWRPCALTPLDNIARVKAHLYRHHRIFQCQRCKNLVANQNVLDEHILALEGCIPNRINLAEGITADIEKRLRSRKKTHRHQTDVERWCEIYQILFPSAAIPSPFFEPIEENVTPASETQIFAEFQEYTRKELPRMVWTALEEVVSAEMQPVEERLRNRFMSVIQDCQDRVFSAYQSMLTSDTLLPSSSTTNRLSTLFETCYEPASAHPPNQSVPSLADVSTTADASEVRSEAGYASNLSVVNSSTTLSSIFDSSTNLNKHFNSSTTLSSISSSEEPPPSQLPTADPSLANENQAGVFIYNSAGQPSANTLSMSNDFWATDLEGTDVSHFEPDTLWDDGMASFDNLE